MPPEAEFLPYGHSTITQEFADYAARNLNETEENKINGLREMRRLLSQKKDLKYVDDDNILLCFLRSRKYDAKRATALMMNCYDSVLEHQNLIERVNLEIVGKVVKAKFLGFLPYRDRKGRAILYVRASAWNPEKISAEDAIFGSTIAMRSAIDNPVNQIVGFMVLFDLKGVTLKQFITMTPWMIFGTKIIQKCCPCFMKEFHVFNTPPIYKTGWKLVKPLLSEKIKKRFIFHKTNSWDRLHQMMSPSVLPEELGGHLGPFNNDHWASDIAFLQKSFWQLCEYGYPLKKKKTPAQIINWKPPEEKPAEDAQS